LGPEDKVVPEGNEAVPDGEPGEDGEKAQVVNKGPAKD
jgi:hypothetical protein